MPTEPTASLRERIKKIFDYSEEDGLHINEILDLISEERQAAKREALNRVKSQVREWASNRGDHPEATDYVAAINNLIEGKGEDA